MFGLRRKRTRGKDAGRRSRGSSAWDFACKVLTLIARILVRTGHSPKWLSREFARICSGLEEPKHGFDPQLLHYVADLAHVVSRWYNDPKFVDAQGAPRALPVRGEGPSLSALLGPTFPRDDPDAVVESLVKFGCVRRRGTLYEPVSRHCILTGDIARLHALSTLGGFLGTVDHNVGGGEPKLLERTVMNPSFPVSALPAFYRRLNQLVDDILKALDHEMQSFEESSTGGSRIRLAVGIFAFENSERGLPGDVPGGGNRAPHAQSGSGESKAREPG